jgi:hypothetical protein
VLADAERAAVAEHESVHHGTARVDDQVLDGGQLHAFRIDDVHADQMAEAAVHEPAAARLAVDAA